MPQRKFLSLVSIILCLSLFGCNAYKDVSLSNDVFLSHKIWKENYDKYVYLVHDDGKTYTLDDVTVVKDSTNTKVKVLSGTSNLLVADSMTKKSKNEIKKEKRKEVHLYLTKDESREIEDGAGIELDETDIQKVTMQGRKYKGVLAVVLGIVGVFVGLILLLFVVLFIALLTNGSGGGSDSNSDPQCYVATMVYGSTESPEVLTLRRFRDQYLKPYKLGRLFIDWYYKNSPSFVARHQSNSVLTSAIKTILDILIRVINRF